MTGNLIYFWPLLYTKFQLHSQFLLFISCNCGTINLEQTFFNTSPIGSWDYPLPLTLSRFHDRNHEKVVEVTLYQLLGMKLKSQESPIFYVLEHSVLEP